MTVANPRSVAVTGRAKRAGCAAPKRRASRGMPLRRGARLPKSRLPGYRSLSATMTRRLTPPAQAGEEAGGLVALGGAAFAGGAAVVAQFKEGRLRGRRGRLGTAQRRQVAPKMAAAGRCR